MDWSRLETFSGFANLHRDLIHLRRNWFGVTSGLQGHTTQILRCDNEKKVIAYHRFDKGGPNDSVVVLINMSHEAVFDYKIGMPLEGYWHVILNSDNPQYDPEFGGKGMEDVTTMDGEMDECSVHLPWLIPAYSVMIYSQE